MAAMVWSGIPSRVKISAVKTARARLPNFRHPFNMKTSHLYHTQSSLKTTCIRVYIFKIILTFLFVFFNRKR